MTERVRFCFEPQLLSCDGFNGLMSARSMAAARLYFPPSIDCGDDFTIDGLKSP